jgi:methionyl-tRNA formyltransferase
VPLPPVSDHLIILLMDVPEANFFRACIGAFPGRRFRRAGSLRDLRRHLRSSPAGVRIISFCSPVIVPPDILSRLPHQCFNFHPGPPEFPGFRPSRLAVAQGAQTFGVTFHTMVEEVDAGTIHAVRRVTVPSGTTRADLDVLTYAALAELAHSLAGPLGNMRHRFGPSGHQWVKPSVRAEE